MPRLAWLHLLIIAGLMISRRPDAVFHPQFWAEDGEVFYHDAYMFGWPALLTPVGGYLNTLSRLVAAFAVAFPLLWAPAIYLVVAAFCQLLPVALILSARMDEVLPSWPARLAMAYFYALMPNSYELNFNLTNAQWHLALAAFLLIVMPPAGGRLLRLFDFILLAISGLSGPFGIFLLPAAWLEVQRRRVRWHVAIAALLSVTSLIQLSYIIGGHATTGRLVTPLGASFTGFVKIIVNNVILGGILGDRMMTAVAALPIWSSATLLVFVAGIAAVMIVVALITGPIIYRALALTASGGFSAALISPQASITMLQWVAMGHPGNGIRYYFLPTLAWLATLIILISSRKNLLRFAALPFIVFAFIGVWFDWRMPGFLPVDFYSKAELFAAAAPGTTMNFTENPYRWSMSLVKK